MRNVAPATKVARQGRTLRPAFASAVVSLVTGPDTVPPTPGAWRSLRPSVRVPARVRRLLPVAAAVFLATWATGACYPASAPALVDDQLHTHGPLVLGLVLAAYLAPSVLGGRFTPAAAQRLGARNPRTDATGTSRQIPTDSPSHLER
ncbi:hypothetical protein [Amycolatopsis sp. NPDC051903]|uniref:hypothetical protein n=1 Tax=Amycolatopsis sp. NPDC051903 TaxID=3363936 RepID=UPI0037B463EC